MEPTNIKFDQFKNASTFSWVGRHASELRLLVNSLEETPRQVLDVGCGPFEPFYLAWMFPGTTTVHAVDVSKDVHQVLNRLNRGEQIPLSNLAFTCSNKDSSGKPILNTDLTDSKLIRLGLSELQLAGIDPRLFVTDERYHSTRQPEDYPRPLPPITAIAPACAEMQEYARQHPDQFGFIYAGVVLLNMGKTKETSELVQVVKSLADSLRENGVLGIGTTPAAIYGEKGDPTLLYAAGLTTTDILVDNLVQIGGALRGGYCVRAVKNPASSTKINGGELEIALAQDSLLSKIECQKQELSVEQLFSYLSKENDNLVLAALKRGGNYALYEAKRTDLAEVVPPQRKTLSLIPRLSDYGPSED
ncbi:MAG: hypothetical protein AABW48_00330 [Nanoarchaeota archaeon]